MAAFKYPVLNEKALTEVKSRVKLNLIYGWEIIKLYSFLFFSNFACSQRIKDSLFFPVTFLLGMLTKAFPFSHH